MKGILIDPVTRSVEAIASDFENAELHKLVEAECLDFAHPLGRTETLVVADDGLERELGIFYIEGYHWPIYGRAVIFGRDAGGGTVSTHLSVEEVFELITFT